MSQKACGGLGPYMRYKSGQKQQKMGYGRRIGFDHDLRIFMDVCDGLSSVAGGSGVAGTSSAQLRYCSSLRSVRYLGLSELVQRIMRHGMAVWLSRFHVGNGRFCLVRWMRDATAACRRFHDSMY